MKLRLSCVTQVHVSYKRREKLNKYSQLLIKESEMSKYGKLLKLDM